VAPRANWKGFIKVGELTIPVALYTAVSASERIAFHMVNRETGHRVRRQFIDEETDKPVPGDEQVKGYEVAKGEYVMLEPDEIAAVIPVSDKTLTVDAFIKCSDIDDLYFERPYYLAPTDQIVGDAFALLREGLRSKEVAALARAVLFRRVRNLLIRVQGAGLTATTLHFDYEVRSAKQAFDDIPDIKIKGEMIVLAKHIIESKRGTFDPHAFADRYDAAVAELVRAKLEGEPIKPRKRQAQANVVDLMEALRQSAGVAAPTRKTGSSKGRKAMQGAAGAKPAAARKATARTARRRKTA
jgi:DNA end-binding protein Ku